MAPWISTPSRPARRALRAAVTKSATVFSISSVVSARGGLAATMPGVPSSVSAKTSVPAAALVIPGGEAWPGCSEVCDIRPQWISWATMRPPASWTAAVTRCHPATCSSVCSPSVHRYPVASGEKFTEPVTISPAVAR